jgi:hypothetical protein
MKMRKPTGLARRKHQVFLTDLFRGFHQLLQPNAGIVYINKRYLHVIIYIVSLKPL